MKAVVAAFNQEKALVGAFSVITNLRMELFEALLHIELCQLCDGGVTAGGAPQQVLREEGAVGGAPEDGAGGGGDHHRDVPRVQGQQSQFKIQAFKHSLSPGYWDACPQNLL